MLLRSALPLLRTSTTRASGLKAWLTSQNIGEEAALPLEHLEHLKSSDSKQHKATQGAAAHKKALSGVIRKSVSRPHLTPYELSQTAKALCEEGQFDKAVILVKEAHWDPKNIIAWGCLLHGYSWAGKHKEAYRLFTDVSHSLTCLLN